MGISSITKRLLLARSGGFCGNPNCSEDLFPLFEKKEVQNIEELAHIIGQKPTGPRGNGKLNKDARDEYKNIIILCPNCHARVDKFPKSYPIQTLLDWKNAHEQRLLNVFNVPQYQTRIEAQRYLAKILLTNKSVFDTYGPNSKLAKDDQNETAAVWQRKAIETIIPNNRAIHAFIERNYYLLEKDEQEVFEQWKRHKESFEFNKLSNKPTSALVFYPEKFNSIFNGKKKKQNASNSFKRE